MRLAGRAVNPALTARSAARRTRKDLSMIDHTPTGDSPYLTIPEAAQRLAVSQRFIQRLIASGELPVHRFGRAVRIKRATLDQLGDDAAHRPIGGRA